jgi:hypothetical protein
MRASVRSPCRSTRIRFVYPQLIHTAFQGQSVAYPKRSGKRKMAIEKKEAPREHGTRQAPMRAISRGVQNYRLSMG